MAARTKRARPVRKVARRRAPRRVTTTTTTTRVVRVGNPRHRGRLAALKAHRDRLLLAVGAREDAARGRPLTAAEKKRIADRVRAWERADRVIQREYRRNPSSTAALRKRYEALQTALERRAIARPATYEYLTSGKAARGFTTHGPGSKEAALRAAQRRAERLFHKRVRPGQRSFFYANPERPDWGANVKHWTPARRAAWRRSSEAAKFRTFKIGDIIDRRLAVYRKRHGSPGPGVMPPELAARHAAYRRAWDVEMRRQAREAREEARERRKRRRNPMAKRKRTAAQKAAFRRMIAGLKRHKARKRKAKARRSSVRSNPHRRRRRKNSTGGSHMAKHRRRRRRNPGRRHHHRRRRNPHHYRRRHHRRRNPGGMGGIVKSTIAAAVPSMAAGAVVALADSKFFFDKSMGVQVVGKLALAAGAGYALRNRPRAAALTMGAIFGTLAYQIVAKSQGGLVAPDKKTTNAGLAALVYADRRMAALVERSGALRTQPTLGGMGTAIGDGGTALPTMPIYDPVNLG